MHRSKIPFTIRLRSILVIAGLSLMGILSIPVVSAAHRYVVGSSADVRNGVISSLNLANTAVTAGSYTNANLTVNAEGQLTAASSGSGFTETDPYSLHTSGGSMSGNVLFTPDNTYVFGSNSQAPASVNSRNFNVTNGTGPIGTLKSNSGVFDVASNSTDFDIDIGGSGGYFLNFLNLTTQTTIGANGAASALTANPVGYLSIKISGTQYVIPYYNH